jgi:hypothetical protein
MPVYTIHAPAAVETQPRSTTDRFVFVRDGFYFWAFLFGPLWLLYRRLWLVLIGWLVLQIGATVALSALHADSGTRFGVMVLIMLLMGLEAGSLWRWTLARRDWPQLDIVVADDEEAAERRFFDRWTSLKQHVGSFQPPVERGDPPPVRRIPVPASSLYTDIVGSFPRPGSQR